MFERERERERPSPTPPMTVKNKLVCVKTSEAEVKQLLLKLDVEKAVGPDNISPCLLHQCADELSRPLATLFNHILWTSKWPRE